MIKGFRISGPRIIPHLKVSMMNVQQMIENIRKIISQCTAPEREVFEALMSEADGWEMRLQELKEEE